ncbi:hypothetical protein FSP39_001858 [Pinctada imbricata]|uniref:CARD domain-containing protein n=1 Tax=Pinctada imbricata TaxID=66713 RepID=A0AA89BYC6_PINIB|nr:hypothetical protein FSP39_001858 [Pinctada imbricata]
MNREQRKRITQNLTNLKERLVDLDPIIDKLIENDVFTLSDRSRIEQVTPCTTQRKFNEFVQLLLASPEPSCYQVFLDALTEERHHYMVERLQNTSRRNFDASGAASGAYGYGGNVDQITSAMTRVLNDFGGKLTKELSETYEKRRQADKEELEQKMEEKLQSFKKDWDEDRKNMLKMNDHAISNLLGSVEKLKRSNEEYEKLMEKYDHLKQKQKEMREKETERWQRLSQSNMENIQLKTTNDGLKGEVKELKEKVRQLEDENRELRDKDRQSQVDLEHLVVENKTLIAELDEKERERAALKQEVELAYGRIHEVVTFQREKSDMEDATYKSALEKQSEKLNEIYEVVNTLTARERVRAAPRAIYIGGNTLTKSKTKLQNN